MSADKVKQEEFTSEELQAIKEKALNLAVHRSAARSKFNVLVDLAKAASLVEYYVEKEERNN